MPLGHSTSQEMYEPVKKWLLRFLSSRFKGSQIRIYNSPSMKLHNLIRNEDLYNGLSPDWPTWEIQVDIIGIIHNRNLTRIAFVDYEDRMLTFNNLAQSVSKARIAKPTYAFLISPQGPNSSLTQLLKTHQRLDVLEYTQDKNAMPRSLIIARWDGNANTIAMDSVITSSFQKVALTKF